MKNLAIHNLLLALLLAAALACSPAAGYTGFTPAAVPPAAAAPLPQPVGTISQPVGTAIPTAAIPVPTATVPLPTTVAPTPTATVASQPCITCSFQSQAAHRHVENLAAGIGSRAAGTSGEELSADYIVSTLESYGYQVERQQFSYFYFGDTGTTLSMTQPERRAFEAQSLTYSRAGRVAGPLADAGLARTSDFAGRDLAGQVALARRGEIRFTEKVHNAAAAGAAAVIIYNNAPAIMQGTLARASSIPAAAVSGQTGQQLLDALNRGPVEVDLDVRTVAEYRPAVNIVARWPGDAPVRVVIGGHYDSVQAGSGANDNASGVAVMLEAARVLAGTPGIAFVAFGAEELGLWGGQSYVNTLSAAELEQIYGMLNLDMVGWDGGSLAAERYGSQSVPLQEMALQVAGELGVPAQGGVSDGGSDHVPFANRGVPVLHFWTGMDPYNHTSRDTIDKINPDSLDAAGRVTVELARRLLP